MEYMSRENVEKTLDERSKAFERIFDRIGEGRIDQDVADRGMDKFRIKGVKYSEFAGIANRVRCGFTGLFEDGKPERIKAGDWVYDKSFFGISFSVEEKYVMYKMRFDRIGEAGREIEIRKWITVEGGRREYGIATWDKERILALVKGNDRVVEVVRRKVELANEEIEKWKKAIEKSE